MFLTVTRKADTKIITNIFEKFWALEWIANAFVAFTGNKSQNFSFVQPKHCYQMFTDVDVVKFFYFANFRIMQTIKQSRVCYMYRKNSTKAHYTCKGVSLSSCSWFEAFSNLHKSFI